MLFADSDSMVTALIIAAGFIAQLVLQIWTKIDAAKALRKIEEQTKQIEVIHKATNSMHDDLVKVVGEEALARGKAVGVKEEKARHSDSKGAGHA